MSAADEGFDLVRQIWICNNWDTWWSFFNSVCHFITIQSTGSRVWLVTKQDVLSIGFAWVNVKLFLKLMIIKSTQKRGEQMGYLTFNKQVMNIFVNFQFTMWNEPVECGKEKGIFKMKSSVVKLSSSFRFQTFNDVYGWLYERFPDQAPLHSSSVKTTETVYP